MTPEQEQLLTEVNERLKHVEQYTTSIGGSLEFKNLIKLYGKENSEFNILKVNTSFGLVVDPVGQQADIVAPTGGVTIDAEARTAIGSILTTLDAFGFTA